MSTELTTTKAALTTMASWVSSIAHNVNNPIAGILAAVHIMEREYAALRRGDEHDSWLIEDSLRRIRERLGSLSEYISELVDFARPLIAVPEIVDTAALIASLRLSLTAISQHTELNFTVEAGASQLSADPTRLKAALKAIILNGIEAAVNQLEPVVRVSAFPTHAFGKSGVAFHIEDNGPGFPQEVLARGFEPFFSTKEAGTGLGLALVKKLMEAHGGAIELGASKDLGGGQVMLFLPHSPTGFS